MASQVGDGGEAIRVPGVYERITLVGSDETVQRFLKRFDVTPTSVES